MFINKDQNEIINKTQTSNNHQVLAVKSEFSFKFCYMCFWF